MYFPADQHPAELACDILTPFLRASPSGTEAELVHQGDRILTGQSTLAPGETTDRFTPCETGGLRSHSLNSLE